MIYHEQLPRYDLGYWLLVTLFPVGFIIGGFWHYTHPEVEDAMAGAITSWGVTIFWVILFWAISPRRYQLLDDSVKVILGGPFSFNILLKSIKKVEYPTTFSSQMYSVHRYLACFNPKYYIWIKRGSISKNAVIAPQDPSLFVESLLQALKES